MRALQTQLALTVDGIVGRQTADALGVWEEPPAAPQQFAAAGNCDPSYPSVCIPPPGPDLDYADVPYWRFDVVGDDPHRFDADDDGIGCES